MVVNVGGARGSWEAVERDTGNGVMVNVGGEQDGWEAVEREAVAGGRCRSKTGWLGGG